MGAVQCRHLHVESILQCKQTDRPENIPNVHSYNSTHSCSNPCHKQRVAKIFVYNEQFIFDFDSTRPSFICVCIPQFRHGALAMASTQFNQLSVLRVIIGPSSWTFTNKSGSRRHDDLQIENHMPASIPHRNVQKQTVLTRLQSCPSPAMKIAESSLKAA